MPCERRDTTNLKLQYDQKLYEASDDLKGSDNSLKSPFSLPTVQWLTAEDDGCCIDEEVDVGTNADGQIYHSMRKSFVVNIKIEARLLLLSVWR